MTELKMRLCVCDMSIRVRDKMCLGNIKLSVLCELVKEHSDAHLFLVDGADFSRRK